MAYVTVVIPHCQLGLTTGNCEAPNGHLVHQKSRHQLEPSARLDAIWGDRERTSQVEDFSTFFGKWGSRALEAGTLGNQRETSRALGIYLLKVFLDKKNSPASTSGAEFCSKASLKGSDVLSRNAPTYERFRDRIRGRLRPAQGRSSRRIHFVAWER